MSATRESRWPVLVRHFPDEKAEADWLVADLVQDRDENTLAWGDFALLYRKHSIGEALEARLVEAGIPCQLAEGRALADVKVVKYLIAALRVIERPGDPILEEQFIKVVLPQALYDTLRADAEQNRTEFVEWLRQLGRQLPHKDEDGRKIRRGLYVLGNLPVFAERHDDLAGLIGELLSQRVGEYRTILEEHAEEITDPAGHPAATELAQRLTRIRYGRGTAWLPRMGGAELGLAGLLREAGVTMVDYQGPEAKPRTEDVVLESGGDPATRCLELFKALQVVAAESGGDAFRDFVSVDVETTDNDADGCDVVELGAVRVRDGVVVEDFQRLVKPTQPVSPRSVAIHGYTEEALADAPDFASVWTEFRALPQAICWSLTMDTGSTSPYCAGWRRTIPQGMTSSRSTLCLSHGCFTRAAGHWRIWPTASGSRPGGSIMHSMTPAPWPGSSSSSKPRSSLGPERRASSPRSITSPSHWRSAIPERRARQGSFSIWASSSPWAATPRRSNHMRRKRARPGGENAPAREEVIERLGGRILMERLRKERTADERYPAAMARLRRLLDSVPETTPLMEQLSDFLDRVALSNTRGGPELDRGRVSLLTLHSTKGLEFPRVYVVGAEDSELPGIKTGNGKRSPAK
jgi:DNA polymerase III, epsilon subunit and related 3''-5'' exonucleases